MYLEEFSIHYHHYEDIYKSTVHCDWTLNIFHDFP